MAGVRKTISQLRTALGQFTGGRIAQETHQDVFESLVEGQEYGPSLQQRNMVTYFDDFEMESIQTTGAGKGYWITFAGTDGDATALAIVAAQPEGVARLGSGDGGTTNDGAVASLILLAQGGLVSTGKQVLEVRLNISAITGNCVNVGLSDTLATDAEHPLYTISGDTIADGGLTLTNALSFVYATEATTTAEWHAVSENAGTIANAAASASSALGIGPTAGTYQTLRIEVDADATARFYINGALQTTVSSACATTARLIPYLAVDGEAGTPVVSDVDFDYVFYAAARETTNA